MRATRFMNATAVLLLVILAAAAGDTARAGKNKSDRAAEDPYAEYVWPPPPDQARIKLEAVIRGRADVEATSRFRRMLLGASPQSRFDRLQKPFGVAFDNEGRLLVTDSALGAVLRFDEAGRRLDVFGTRGRNKLKTPLGIHTGPDGTFYVADGGLRKVIAFDGEGAVRKIYGKKDELTNPTDAVLSPDGERLFVADSRAHAIVVFDAVTGERLTAFGKRGAGEGEFNYPTSLAFGPDGDLFVVDQMNARVQMLTVNGEYLDHFGARGVGHGNFVRPKDVAVDEQGLLYVTDNAFNNMQLFDADFTLLTFVGEGGLGPGQLQGAAGVAVHGDRFALVDQLGGRLQVFRFIGPEDGRKPQ